MARSRRFGLTLLVFWAAAFAVGVVATPPDPLSQTFVVVLLAILAVPLAYVVVYSLGGDLDEEDGLDEDGWDEDGLDDDGLDDDDEWEVP